MTRALCWVKSWPVGHPLTTGTGPPCPSRPACLLTSCDATVDGRTPPLRRVGATPSLSAPPPGVASRSRLQALVQDGCVFAPARVVATQHAVLAGVCGWVIGRSVVCSVLVWITVVSWIGLPVQPLGLPKWVLTGVVLETGDNCGRCVSRVGVFYWG